MIKSYIKKKLDFLFKNILTLFFKYSLKIYIFTLGFFKFSRNVNFDLYDKLFEDLKNKYDENSLPDNFSSKFIIQKDFILDLAYLTQISIKTSPPNIEHGKILYSLLSNYLEKQDNNDFINIYEIGTAKGFSSICMAKSLDDLGFVGKIFSFDVLAHTEKRLWNSIADRNNIKSRKELIKNWDYLINKYIVFISGFSHINIKNIYLSRINFAFIDGSHYGHDINYEFSHISKYQSSGDIIFFDDYDKSKFPDLVKSIDILCDFFNYKKTVLNFKSNRNYVIAEKK